MTSLTIVSTVYRRQGLAPCPRCIGGQLWRGSCLHCGWDGYTRGPSREDLRETTTGLGVASIRAPSHNGQSL